MSQRRMTSSDGPDSEDVADTSKKNSATNQSLTNDADECGGSQSSPLLSDELLSEFGSQDIILSSKNKKDSRLEQKRKLDQVEITPQELRLAQQQSKQQKRKLQQIQQRQQQKQLRQKLYTSLEQYSIGKPSSIEPSNGAQLLLHKSSHLGKKVYTKKEQLQRALQKERLGVALTVQESGLLYSTVSLPSTLSSAEFDEPMDQNHSSQSHDERAEEVSSLHSKLAVTDSDETIPAELNPPNELEMPPNVSENTQSSSANTSTLAAQMMASIFSLQKKNFPSSSLTQPTSTASQSGAKNDSEDDAASTHNTFRKSTDDVSMTQTVTSKPTPYIPPPPLVLQTTPSYASSTTVPSSKLVLRNCVSEISNRPLDVIQLRQELPVVMMEFEIMDTIRNHDVVIVCSETGSGKSTQIPQFLSEAGYNRNVDNSNASKLMIGITQPRRVAAVSSAKRVCYEMGFGNGQSISKNNVVSYQTRYESAGYGNNTAIQFMTDGILLQEIQSDLLLRKYSVIILDEAHERNLNTDILIGLLSVALPLRKQASLESSDLPPLKVIIMSATLRTEDFTKNPRLFAAHPPAVVEVPGRTYPVTIHHSKVTELDNYGTVNDIVFVLIVFVCVSFFLS